MTTIAVNSIIRWTLNKNTYRTLVRTKTGFLQVKSVHNGIAHHEFPINEWDPVRPKTTPFYSFEAWFASLPKVGSVTVSSYNSNLRGKMDGLEGSDTEKMYALTSRFQIFEPDYNFKERAFLVVGGTVKNVYCESENEHSHYIRVEGDDTRYTSFADIGDCLDENKRPKITVQYHDTMIPVAELF